MIEKKPNPSDAYQHIFNEIPTDMTPGEHLNDDISFLATKSTQDALWYEEVCQDELSIKRVNKLEQTILNAMLTLILPHLTLIQKETIHTMLQHPDNTQRENVKIMRDKKFTDTKIYQGTVVYVLKGHHAKWKNGIRIPNQSGGIIAKIRRFCLIDEQFRILIHKLYHLDDANRYIKIIRSLFNSYNDFITWTNEPIDPLTNLTIINTNKIKQSILLELLDKTNHIATIPKSLNRSLYPTLKVYKYSDVNKVYAAYKSEFQDILTGVI